MISYQHLYKLISFCKLNLFPCFQLNTLELVDITPSIPSNSPRFGGPLNLTLTVTPDIANGEIGFTNNTTVVLYEPENSNTSMVRYVYCYCFDFFAL